MDKDIKKESKGFALTLDALFAVLLLFMVIVFISTSEFKQRTERGTYMKLVSMDTLKVLEDQGRISAAITGNTTSVREVFNMLQSNICMSLNVLDEGQSNVSVAKQDCYGFADEVQIINRGYVYNGKFYTAQLSTWLKS